MDNQRGLGHVMDVKKPRRNVFHIEEYPGAYADLYFNDSKLWLGDAFLSCESLSANVPHFFFIGNQTTNKYLALKLPMRVIKTSDFFFGITSAQQLLFTRGNSYLRTHEIFVPVVAYGQLTTSSYEIPGVIPKNRAYEIIVFNQTKIVNLELFLSKTKDNIIPNVLSFWIMAFATLKKVHEDGFRIYRSEARNTFLVNDKIMWADSTLFENIADSQPLAKNMKKLSDINRLLLENGYIEVLSGQSADLEELYTNVYKMTQANFPLLSKVIFFSRNFLFLDEWTNSDMEMRKQIESVYKQEDVKKRTDIPTMENFIITVNAINFTDVYKFLSEKLETFLNQIAIWFLKESRNTIYSPWKFQNKRLFIVTNEHEPIGPVFIMNKDKLLYTQSTNGDFTALTSMEKISLHTDTEELMDDKGHPVKFTYSIQHKDITYNIDNTFFHVKCDDFSSQINLKLFNKPDIFWSATSHTSAPSSSHSTPPSASAFKSSTPTTAPIRETRQRLLEMNKTYFIKYKNLNLAIEVENFHGQHDHYEIAYMIDNNQHLHLFYGFGQTWHPLPALAGVMKAYGYSPDERKWKVFTNDKFYIQNPYVYFVRNNRNVARINLLYEPHVVEPLF